MKKFILGLLASIPLIGLATNTKAASSTVMLDTPDIADVIDKIWQVANPLFNSVSNWVWFLLAFGFVAFVITLVLGFFKRH